jgi:predicted nucleic-acid-binding protein
MVEMAWVLERSYRLAAAEIATAIERVLQAAELIVESEQEVFTALIALRQGHGSLPMR